MALGCSVASAVLATGALLAPFAGRLVAAGGGGGGGGGGASIIGWQSNGVVPSLASSLTTLVTTPGMRMVLPSVASGSMLVRRTRHLEDNGRGFKVGQSCNQREFDERFARAGQLLVRGVHMRYEFYTTCWIGIPTVFLGSIRTWEEGGRQRARRFDPIRLCIASCQAVLRCVSQKGEDNIGKDLHTTANGAVGRCRLGHLVPLVEDPA